MWVSFKPSLSVRRLCFMGLPRLALTHQYPQERQGIDVGFKLEYCQRRPQYGFDGELVAKFWKKRITREENLLALLSRCGGRATGELTHSCGSLTSLLSTSRWLLRTGNGSLTATRRLRRWFRPQDMSARWWPNQHRWLWPRFVTVTTQI
jgi:hypothetical protein